MKKIKFILIIFILCVIYIYTVFINGIPENLILMEGENLQFKNLFGIEYTEIIKTYNELDSNCNQKSQIEVSLFGKIPLKNVNIETIEDISVIPVGKIIGLKLYTNGVLVVGMSEIESINNEIVKPFEYSDIKEGDTIVKIDENYIEDISSLKENINKANGCDLNITLIRNGNMINTSIHPIETKKDEYKLGLWVKDAATGVGTMTFYEPKSNAFAVLGHGITDSDTDTLINIDSGELVTSHIISIKKGENENPGELKGTIINQKSIGEVKKNTQFGVYGILNNLTSLNIDLNKRYKVALRNEIKLGNAKVLCSVDNSNIPNEYDIEIEKIYENNDFNNKSMLIRITDNNLINKTGGIIRGLSGSPIIQDGKFVGAITNVLVSNPQIGYAVFGEIMIKEMRK